MIVSEQGLNQYRENGFLLLKDFVAPEECDRLKTRAEALVQAFDPAQVVSIFSTNEQDRIADEYFLTSGDKIRFFFEENAFNLDGTLKYQKEKCINKVGHALHDLDPVFDRFSRDPKIKALAADLGFEDPYLLQSMYIFKQPNIGGEVNCHQDSTFLYTEPVDIVGLWFAIEDATIENGCLWAIPGGHRRGLKSRWVRADQGMKLVVFDEEPWDEKRLEPLEASKGSLIVLDGLLPHRSFENKSARSRHAYTLHLIRKDAKYPKENWLQRELPLRGF
jgi:phytanoyl-CoA hydroxylase